MICEGCGEDKKIKAHGLCSTCYQRQWRENNPIKYNAIQTRYKNTHEEEIKQYASNNPEIIKAAHRRYYLKNADKIKEYEKKRYHERKNAVICYGDNHSNNKKTYD